MAFLAVVVVIAIVVDDIFVIGGRLIDVDVVAGWRLRRGLEQRGVVLGRWLSGFVGRGGVQRGDGRVFAAIVVVVADGVRVRVSREDLHWRRWLRVDRVLVRVGRAGYKVLNVSFAYELLLV